MKKGYLGGLGASLVALVVAMPAAAQVTATTATSVDAAGAKKDDTTVVVVTGTLLRGKAPVGTNLISMGQDKVTSTGVTNSNDLLATVPQVVNYFNNVPANGLTVATQSQVSRPNLRNLPGGALATGAATLVIIDGHRVAGAGVTQLAVDPDIVPAGALERVEIVSDGGSATYGADAVGGVINFITRRKFNGVKFDARYGAADSYSTYDSNLTAGKDWGSGSAYVSVSYAHNDALYARDRTFAKRLDYSVSPAVPTGTQCDLANIAMPGLYLPAYNITLPGANYALPGKVANTLNRCDVLADTTLIPEIKRQGLFAGLSQDISDTVKLDVRAFYSRREMESDGGPLRSTVAVPSTNPYYIPIPSNPTATQQVSFSYGPALGRSNVSTSVVEEKGINSTFTVSLNDNWQLRSLFNYSDSESSYFAPDINPSLLSQYGAGTTTPTAINPYDINATVNKQLLSNLANYAYAGESKDKLLNQRDILDGKLFSLPGGDVRVAAGVEFSTETFQRRYNAGTIGSLNSMAFETYKRNVSSVFTEVQVPIVGTTNNVPGIHSLVLSLSGRYDDYSDFGVTKNPKIGLNYQPVSWTTIYGNWGTSFNAPTPVDQLGSSANSILAVPFVAALKPGDPAQPAGSWTIALMGSHPNLKPQTADTWSVGFNMSPPVVPGLRFNVSYYSIFFKGTLGKPEVFNATKLFNIYPDSVTLHPSDAQITAFGQQAAATGGVAQVAPFLGGARTVYELLDYRTANLGNTKLSGLDFSLNYTHDTSFGSVDASVGGNYQLTRKTQASSLAAFVNDLTTDVSRLSVQTNLGANIGDFRAQITYNHRAGYDVVRAANLPQDKVKDFDVVNMFFKYSVPDGALLKDVDLTLNINNLFDRDPPVYLASGGSGYANGFGVGRLVMIGVSKKF